MDCTCDGFGQLWERNSPDTGTTTYSYASDGQLQGYSRADGTLITTTYDALGRPTAITTGTQTRHMTYDSCTNGIGRVCSVSDATGTTSYTYDPQGDITRRQFTLGSTTYALGYSYDGSGRLATLTYPDGNQASYHYQDGRLSGITATVGGSTKTVASGLTYRGGDQLLTSWTAGNGLTTTFNYDTDGRLTGIHVPGVQSLDFTYDDADRIIDIVNGVNPIITQKFTYDAMSRLASIDSPSGQATYQYDANGNRTAKVNNGVVTASSMATSSNRLVSVGGQAIGYDANGNTISEGGVVKYHYDSFNRLVSAGGMTYYINPEGQRLRKSGTLGTTYFAPDRSGTLLAEHPDSGWVDYVWLGGRLVGRLAGGQVDAVHTDQVGRPEAVTNASGAVVWQSLNFPFVRTVSKEGITLNIGFPGQYYDAETGLWHNGFRDYAPTLGRYIESDPTGLTGGLNTYVYVGGNPISNVDLYGLWDWPSLPQWLVNGSAGLGDALSFGLTRWGRHKLGIGAVDECSASYHGGQAAGIIASFMDGEGEAQIAFKTAHYAPRLLRDGVDIAEAEAAVSREVNATLSLGAEGSAVGEFSGRISIGGTQVEYRAHPLPNGTINVGTIFVPKW